jgi:hypothetical protein
MILPRALGLSKQWLADDHRGDGLKISPFFANFAGR